MSEAAFYSKQELNLSVAWARAFLGLLGHPRKEYVPFLVSIAGLYGAEPEAEADLRDALDACLDANGHDRVQTVANTIFPQSLWRRAKEGARRSSAATWKSCPRSSKWTGGTGAASTLRA